METLLVASSFALISFLADVFAQEIVFSYLGFKFQLQMNVSLYLTHLAYQLIETLTSSSGLQMLPLNML